MGKSKKKNAQLVIKETLLELQNGENNVESCYATIYNEYQELFQLKLSDINEKLKARENKIKKQTETNNKIRDELEKESSQLEKREDSLNEKEAKLNSRIKKFNELNAILDMEINQESLDDMKQIYKTRNINPQFFETLVESGDIPDYRIDDILKRENEQNISRQYYMDLEFFCKKYRVIVSNLTIYFSAKTLEDFHLPHSLVIEKKATPKEILLEKIKTIINNEATIDIKANQLYKIVDEESENCLGVFNHATVDNLYYRSVEDDFQNKLIKRMVDKILLFCPIFICVDKALDIMKRKESNEKAYYAFYYKYIKPGIKNGKEALEGFNKATGAKVSKTTFFNYSDVGKNQFINSFYFYLDTYRKYEEKEDIQMLFRNLLKNYV